MINEEEICVIRHLFAVSGEQNEETYPEIQEILQEYKDVFSESTQLPQRRLIEHEINLKPEAIPKRQAPYRYSHTFKAEIEKIIEEMLKSGISNIVPALLQPLYY